ncbi:MAG: carboxypeptidase-like regulatory domain-containing protein, partial [Bacteroidota bacterium]
MKKFLPFLLGILLSLSFSGLSVHSQAPTFTSATIVKQGSDYRFHLVWVNTTLLTSEFRFYVANANVTSTSDPAFGPAGSHPGSTGDSSLHSYQYDIDFTGYGDFSIYITSVVGGTEYPSLIKHVNFPPPPVVTFTTTPITTGVVGATYTYNANAIATPTATLNYSLVTHPSGMIINPTTGAVTWATPTHKGTYNVGIKAFVVADPTIFEEQGWTLEIKQCPTDEALSGTVKDGSGNPVTSGTIDVYTEVTDSNNTHWVLFTTIEIASDGTYTHDFDGGNYKLYIHGNSFDSEWYQDQTSEATATVVVIACGSPTTADFVVNAITPHYTVSGKVYKSDGITPIERAKVHFYGMLPGQTVISFQDMVLTSHSGDYSISLSADYEYKSMAEAPGADSANPIPVYYQSQFWDHVSDPNDASTIILSGNQSGIDFSLGDVVNTPNKLYGQVNGQTAGNKIKSWVMIFYVYGAGADLYSLRTFDATATNGAFEFNGLADGSYIIQSIPVDDTYSYGYHCTDAPGTVVSDWTTATQLPINTTSQSGSHEVLHPHNTTGSGIGVFSGVVGAGLPGMELNTDKNNKLQADNPIAGAVVYVLSSSDQKIVKCGPSNHQGEFNIKGLPIQSYDVIVDKVGYKKVISTFKLDAQNTTENKTIEMPPFVSDVNEENRKPYLAIYPNPSVDNINIDFYTKENSVDIDIVNT